MKERKKKPNKMRSMMVAAVWLIIPAGVLLQFSDVVIILAWLVTFLLVMVRDQAESLRGLRIIRSHQQKRRDFVRNVVIEDARRNGPTAQALRRRLDDDDGIPPVKVTRN